MEYAVSAEVENILNQCKLNARTSHPTPSSPTNAPKIKQKLLIRTDIEGTETALQELKKLSVQGQIPLLISDDYQVKTGKELYRDVSRFCSATKHDLMPVGMGMRGRIEYRCRDSGGVGCPFCMCFEWTGKVWRHIKQPEHWAVITRTCPLLTEIPKMRRDLILKALEPAKKKKKKSTSKTS